MIKDTSVLTIDVGGNCLKVAEFFAGENNDSITLVKYAIKELSAETKPRIYVYNKSDKPGETYYTVPQENTVIISAKEGKGIDTLLNTIEKVIHDGKAECELLIPYNEQSKVSVLYDHYTVLSVDYTDDGILVKAMLGTDELGMFSKYIVN